MRAGPELASAVLPVDFALLPSATTAGTFDRLAVATAGNQDGSEPVLIASAPALSADGCIGASVPVSAREAITQTIAVSYLGDRRLVLQQRDPSRLVVLDESGAETRRVALGGDAAFDTGHALFHASTAAGIACASCHPEGGEDGHVWRFMGIGERRTPALHSVSGTAPFHWNGELTDVRALMNEVFVLRMRGTGIDAERADAVEGWLGHVPTPRASSGDGAAIARGRALFAGAGGCAECHSGRALTDGESHDVGTGGSFQTPSLIGVGDRLPVMHTGCASTLRARFEPACGGDRHGDALEPAQLADVVAYMESL